MSGWQKVLISPGSTLRETIRVINDGAIQIALVVDQNRKLLGTVTDGDIRRGLLKGYSLDDKIEQLMNTSPITANIHASRDDLLAMLKQGLVHQIPIVDEHGRVVDVEVLEGLLQPCEHSSWVVIMAGGLGSRLWPLTEECPKPLLKVGSKPVLETIVENFIACGFRNFYLAIHYKAEMVKAYFGDGSRWGVRISYLEEDERLGTAGALALLPEQPREPIVVMNGDLLTKLNFNHLLSFHRESGAKATMCVREYDFQVPFGVVTIDNHRIRDISEKPVQSFFVNAGIYVLDPGILEHIPRNSYFDMTSLFERLLETGEETVVFPISEYWLDIGRFDDLERARSDFDGIFK